MNHFNLLPPEIIEFIFKKVYFDDLINLRDVDKRFRQICEQIKIKQLCVTGYNPLNWFYTNSPLIWFYTNDPTFDMEDVISLKKFHNYSKFFQLDKHLKRLTIHIDSDFRILNQFKLLEQLNVKAEKLLPSCKLSLDHLKIANFNFNEYCYHKLTLDTVKLFDVKLVSCSVKNVVFNYPDKILYLEINRERDLTDSDYLKNFNNLQYLKLSGFYSISRDILLQIKNLKTIDLHLRDRVYHNNLNDNLVEEIKFLIEDKKNLRRSELEIYLNGVKLINQDIINQFKLSSNLVEFKSNLLEFQIKNYDLLKDNCDDYVTSRDKCYKNNINYCDLVRLITIIPSSFTNKFQFIHRVEANDHIDNEEQFIQFLNNLQHLSELVLINCGLTKSFYDQLINLVYLNDLKYLTIKEKKDLGINFDFIQNLKRLKWFQTNQIITNYVDLIDKLSKINNVIFKYEFKFDSENYIRIFRDDSFVIKYYHLDDNLEEINNFSIDNLECLDDVITKLKELKS